MKERMLWLGVALCCVLFAPSNGWEINIDTLSDDVVLPAGINARIMCTVDKLDAANGKPEIRWDSPTGPVANTGLLYLQEPSVAQTGKYTCKVKVDGGGDERAININFVERSKFLEFPLEQHPEVGTDAQINCQVSIPEKAELFWTKDGSLVQDDERVAFAQYNTILIKRNFTLADNGVYTCNLPQKSSNIIDSRPIRVTGHVRPVITKLDSPASINEGQDAKFVCHYSGLPEPHLKWWKATQSLRPEEVFPSEKYKQLSDKDQDTLIVKNVSAVDIGNYTCRIESIVGSAEQWRTLVVNTKPQITSRKGYYANKNANISIPCSAVGATKVEWMVNSEVATPLNSASEPQRFGTVQNGNDTILIYRNFTDDDDISLVCRAENLAGYDEWTVILNLTKEPEITAHPPAVVRVVSGQAFELQCEATGIPNIEWKWYHDSGTIDGVNDRFFTNSSDTGKSTLKVSAGNVGRGKFFCEANNKVGFKRSPDAEIMFIETPKLPAIICGNTMLPNRAKCNVDYKSASPNELPTQYDIEVTTGNGSTPVLMNAPFDGTNITITPLNTSTGYHARFKARNEAGATEWSPYSTFNTTNPWAPDSVTQINSHCEGGQCTITWMPQNDNGAPIINYHVYVSQPNSTNNDGFSPSYATGTSTQNNISMSSLPGNANYEARVTAVNEVGNSPNASAVFYVPVYASNSSLMTIALIGLVVVLVVIGIAVCLATKCCRKSGAKETLNGVNVEEGEQLVQPATVPATTTTTTVTSSKRIIRG